jgi:hypothetical protein
MDRRIAELAARERAAHADPTIRIRRIAPMSLVDRVAADLEQNGPSTASEIARRVDATRSGVASALIQLKGDRAHRSDKKNVGRGRPQTVWAAGPEPEEQPVQETAAPDEIVQEAREELTAGLVEHGLSSVKIEVVEPTREQAEEFHAAEAVEAAAAARPWSTASPESIGRLGDALADSHTIAVKASRSLDFQPLEPLQPVAMHGYIRTPLRERYADELLDLVRELKADTPVHILDRLERLIESEAAA